MAANMEDIMQNALSPDQMIELNMQVTLDMYTRMQTQCFDKCILNYKEGELSSGERVCAERCVNKFIQTSKKVGAKMQGQTNQ
mmetsp:Transcript_96447/g.144337  ORF Transcript_96447/g.144337 Transcript_96447/m.144337 type:complete len:83 (+) Transcript_96447:23-271(+)